MPLINSKHPEPASDPLLATRKRHHAVLKAAILASPDMMRLIDEFAAYAIAHYPSPTFQDDVKAWLRLER